MVRFCASGFYAFKVRELRANNSFSSIGTSFSLQLLATRGPQAVLAQVRRRQFYFILEFAVVTSWGSADRANQKSIDKMARGAPVGVVYSMTSSILRAGHSTRLATFANDYALRALLLRNFFRIEVDSPGRTWEFAPAIGRRKSYVELLLCALSTFDNRVGKGTEATARSTTPYDFGATAPGFSSLCTQFDLAAPRQR